MEIKKNITVIEFCDIFCVCRQRAKRHSRGLWGIDIKAQQSAGVKREISINQAWSLFLSLELTKPLGSDLAKKIAGLPWFHGEYRKQQYIQIRKGVEIRISYSNLWKDFTDKMFQYIRLRSAPWR